MQTGLSPQLLALATHWAAVSIPHSLWCRPVHRWLQSGSLTAGLTDGLLQAGVPHPGRSPSLGMSVAPTATTKKSLFLTESLSDLERRGSQACQPPGSVTPFLLVTTSCSLPAQQDAEILCMCMSLLPLFSHFLTLRHLSYLYHHTTALRIPNFSSSLTLTAFPALPRPITCTPARPSHHTSSTHMLGLGAAGVEAAEKGPCPWKCPAERQAQRHARCSSRASFIKQQKKRWPSEVI